MDYIHIYVLLKYTYTCIYVYLPLSAHNSNECILQCSKGPIYDRTHYDINERAQENKGKDKKDNTKDRKFEQSTNTAPTPIPPGATEHQRQQKQVESQQNCYEFFSLPA